MNYLITFKLSQDPLENFFSSIRASCGSNNNPTSIQFKSAFQSLLCKTLNRTDNGNSYFDETLSLVDLTSVPDVNFDLNLAEILSKENTFTENVLIYMSGFVMKTLLDSEKCTYCRMYLENCKDRVTCHLIENKQRGGLLQPIVDVVAIVKIANSAYDLAIEKGMQSTPDFGIVLMKEIVSEIVIKNPNLLDALNHNKEHKINMMKKIVTRLISSKGKHCCRSDNTENSILTRQKNTKFVLFNRE